MSSKTSENKEKLGTKLKDLLSIPSSLLIVFITTLLMRASFYLAIAILNYPHYLTHLSSVQKTWIFIVYPLSELLTVLIFGVLSDKIGRKIIYYIGLSTTGIAILLFSFVSEFVLLLIVSSILGIGAAAQVASTLSIVADEAPENKRGRFMGFYDAMTLIGLGLGFGGGFLIMEILFGKEDISIMTNSQKIEFYERVAMVSEMLFIVAAVLLFVSLTVAILLLKQKQFVKFGKEQTIREKVAFIIKDKNLRYLMPVWIPIICLYAIVLTNAEELAHTLNLHDIKLLIVLAIIFGSILIGFPLNGILSDKIGRKPFLYIGMFSFAGFVTVLIIGAEQAKENNPNLLLYLSPLMFILGIGCGAFPPAALALLTDLSPKENYGSSMGAYSVVYGTGMIIGPLSAEFSQSVGGLFGLIVLIWILCAISVFGTLLVPKHLLSKGTH